MDIEILNFYPEPAYLIPKGSMQGWTYIGTLSLYIHDLDIELRGIKVQIKAKDFLFVGATVREFRQNALRAVNAFSFYEENSKSEFHKFLQSKAKLYIRKIMKKDPDYFIPKPIENQSLATQVFEHK